MNERVRNARKQWNKLKGKGVRAHLDYIFEYYKGWLFAAACVIFLVAYIINMAVTRKENVLNVFMLNASGAQYNTDAEAGKFMEENGFDEKKQQVIIDDIAYLTPGGIANSNDMAAVEKITVYAANGDIDVMIADAYNFYYYSDTNLFADLRDVLPQKELDRYKDTIYYVDRKDMEERQAYAETDDAVNAKPDYEAATVYEKKDSFKRPDPSKMQDPVPLGIIVTDAPYIQKNELYPETVAILGFASQGKNKDNALRFLEYLYK